MTLNELDMLKQKADQMGVPYKSNIGIETLRAKINAKLNDEPDVPDDEEEDDNTKAAPQKAQKKMSKAEIMQAERDRQAKEEMALVRVRISCLNPAKREIKGEIVTVANRFVGTVRKFVPFGEATDEGYHLPRILLNELKSRKFNSVTTRKGPNGQMLPVQRLVPEFAIEELEPLTQEQLNKLAAAQAAAAGA